MKILFSICLFCSLSFYSSYGQALNFENFNSYKTNWTQLDTSAGITLYHFIGPTLAITYGALTLSNNSFKEINKQQRTSIQKNNSNFKTGIDNYLQFAPAAAVFGLDLIGVKGRNKPIKQAIVLATTFAVSSIIVTPIKHWSHELRPDGSNYMSFPSGHTTTAFATAEFLRIEYGQTSPWIAVAGYAAATATGILRMYNNKHWLSDVIAGAGIGIISTNLSYIIIDNILKSRIGNWKFGVYPSFQNNSYGVGLVKLF